MYTERWWETLKERDHLEDIGMEKRNVIKWVLKQTVGGREMWIDLVLETESWQALVNAVINLRVP
jgi:hypothetical protein